ncbi:MAG TPA: glycosyltransferase family 4 protein [Anaerolineae bacterium]|nr:glycosyltransferase family 4 protein [Anaerolineae bacterium]
MHILFVSPTPPVPTSGGRTRLYNLIKQLATRHEISLLTFVQPGEQDMLGAAKPHLQVVQSVSFAAFPTLGVWQNRFDGWKRILLSPRPRYAMIFPTDQLRGPLRRLIATHRFDVVILQPLYVAELSDEIRETPVILATENVESEIARRNLANARNAVHRLRDWLEWRKLRDYEHRIVRRFRVCTAVSALDAAALNRIAPYAETYLVPNGVDTQAYLPEGHTRRPNEILFFGTLNYAPNAEGIAWFCRDVLPHVRAEIPDARLAIVGRDAPERVRELAACPGVELVGFVPDVRDRLWSATLSIAPLHSGGGTRLKILEAFAAKCPVVSTTVGVEGLEVRNDEHVIIGDSAEEFSRGIVNLLQDPDARARLTENARQLVEQRYDWQLIAVTLEQACVRAKQLFG